MEITMSTDSNNYTPPATQEDLNRIINERLSRERAKFSDYDALKAQVASLTSERDTLKTEVDTLNAKVSERDSRDALEALKSDLVKESHVPASALRGTTEDELKTHLAELEQVIPKPSGPAVPGVENTPDKVEETEERKFVRGLFGNNES